MYSPSGNKMLDILIYKKRKLKWKTPFGHLNEKQKCSVFTFVQYITCISYGFSLFCVGVFLYEPFTLHHTIPTFDDLDEEALSKIIVRKGESAENKHFLRFPLCFQPIPKEISRLSSASAFNFDFLKICPVVGKQCGNRGNALPVLSPFTKIVPKIL